MPEKNLPIKFFQKRPKDEWENEGGGGKAPKWVLKGEALVKRSKKLKKYFKGFDDRMQKKAKDNNYLPSVVVVKLDANATAKSHRSSIGELFNVRNKMNLIGFAGFDEVLVKIDNEEDLKSIQTNFRRVEDDSHTLDIARGISAITNLSDLTPIVNLEKENETVFKIKLINYQDYDLNETARRMFESFCQENEIKLTKGRYRFDENIYRAEASMDSINELLEFDGLMSVEDMPSFILSEDETMVNEKIIVKNPANGKKYPVVGVLDTGIERIPQLDPWLVKDRQTYYPPDYENKRHGTLVASILVHGDELEGKSYTNAGGCHLYEACVFPDKDKTSIREDELIYQIEDTIRRSYKEIKIWNLSLGTFDEASYDNFSDFGKALDSIQEECSVLIVKSVGNCENFKVGKPRARIARSADSIRSLVVGSITHEKGEHDYYPIHHPSPFTRSGPGPSYINKPDLVHIGGNAGMFAGKPVYTGVKAFGIDGNVKRICGTSFSTPRITALAAGLYDSLNEPFDPLLIKALIIHNAKYPKEMDLDISDKIRFAGFGVPSTLDNTLYNDPDEITLIMQDNIQRGSSISVMEFPYPQDLIDKDGYYYGEITVTLVADPILEPKQQGGEYCQSNIEVLLGSYEKKKERDISKPNIKNPIGTDGGQNLLSDTLYSKNAMKDPDNKFKTDRVLIAYEKKYHPVKKWVINLTELKNGNKDKYLLAPKQWYLKLTSVFREHTETMFEKQQKNPSQDFCLIITIRDTKQKGKVYNEVSKLLDQFNFIHKNVRVHDHVRVKVGI